MGTPSDQLVDVEQLKSRGWTTSLITKFLGAPDNWAPVDHWANWTGKRQFLLRRILLAEQHPDFVAALQRSLSRRKCTRKQVNDFARVRAAVTIEQLDPGTDASADAIRESSFREVASIFREARRRGYRTPYKA